MAIPYTGEKAVGQYDYDGACAPWESVFPGTHDTFSVGIFQVEAKTRGSALKRGKVLIRVSGDMDKPELVLDRADMICDLLNSGKKTVADFPKNIKAK